MEPSTISTTGLHRIWYRCCPSLEGEPKARRSAPPEVASQSEHLVEVAYFRFAAPRDNAVPSREQATEKNDPATSPIKATDDRTRRNVPELKRSKGSSFPQSYPKGRGRD
jgi:hypothetical protein